MSLFLRLSVQADKGQRQRYFRIMVYLPSETLVNKASLERRSYYGTSPFFPSHPVSPTLCKWRNALSLSMISFT